MSASCCSGNLSAPQCRIGPSILAGDLADLGAVCEQLVTDGADYLHLDVMDGAFVPNITFGAPVVKCLRRKVQSSFFDLHMMVAEPEKWITDMHDAGADQYTFHVEATERPQSVIRLIKESGMKAGLAIKPNTAVAVTDEQLMKCLEEVDMVLIMTVEPGFGGQKFMENMMGKIELIRETFPFLNIGVDGGVGPSNVEVVASAGANMIVSGTAITGSDDPKDVMNQLRAAVVKHLK